MICISQAGVGALPGELVSFIVCQRLVDVIWFQLSVLDNDLYIFSAWLDIYFIFEPMWYIGHPGTDYVKSKWFLTCQLI